MTITVYRLVPVLFHGPSDTVPALKRFLNRLKLRETVALSACVRSVPVSVQLLSTQAGSGERLSSARYTSAAADSEKVASGVPA